MLTKTPKRRVLGEAYERNRFEVHNRWSDGDGAWYCVARSAQTLEEAGGQIAKDGEWRRSLRPFIDVAGGARCEYRIVKVTAKCEVVA